MGSSDAIFGDLLCRLSDTEVIFAVALVIHDIRYHLAGGKALSLAVELLNQGPISPVFALSMTHFSKAKTFLRLAYFTNISQLIRLMWSKCEELVFRIVLKLLLFVARVHFVATEMHIFGEKVVVS